MANTNDRSRGYEAAAKAFEDGIARICDLYGLSPLVGRLYAALFLSAEPVSLEDLAIRVDAAKSTVSVALRKLLTARVVRRLPPRGDRRDFYEAVTDPWAALSDWIRIYFQPELDMWRETSSGLEGALKSAKDAPKGQEKTELLRRIRELDEFGAAVTELLGALQQERQPRERARTIAITKKGDR